MRVDIAGQTVIARVSTLHKDNDVIVHLVMPDRDQSISINDGDVVTVTDPLGGGIWLGSVYRVFRDLDSYFWSVLAIDDQTSVYSPLLIAAFTDLESGDNIRAIFEHLLDSEGISYLPGFAIQGVHAASGTLTGEGNLTGNAAVVGSVGRFKPEDIVWFRRSSTLRFQVKIETVYPPDNISSFWTYDVSWDDADNKAWRIVDTERPGTRLGWTFEEVALP